MVKLLIFNRFHNYNLSLKQRTPIDNLASCFKFKVEPSRLGSQTSVSVVAASPRAPIEHYSQSKFLPLGAPFRSELARPWQRASVHLSLIDPLLLSRDTSGPIELLHFPSKREGKNFA